MAKTIKKLDLKRETVRSLGVKAGILTGLDPVQLDSIHLAQQVGVKGSETAKWSVVGGAAAATRTHGPIEPVPTPLPGSLGGSFGG